MGGVGLLESDVQRKLVLLVWVSVLLVAHVSLRIRLSSGAADFCEEE